MIEPPAETQTNAPTAEFPGAIALLKQAWSLYKERAGIFLAITVIPLSLAEAASFIWILVGKDWGLQKFVAGDIFPVVCMGVVYILVACMDMWAQMALIYAIKDSAEGIGLVTSFRRAWPKLISYGWLIFLAGWISVGGFFLFIIPGIIFSIWFSLATYVLIVEDIKGMDALVRSREYVRGKWGVVFWRFTLLGLAGGAVYFIVYFLFGRNNHPAVERPIPFFTQWLLVPMAAGYGWLIYKNLKMIKGELNIAPSGGQKSAYIAVGAAGMLFLALFLWLGLPVIKKAFPNMKWPSSQGVPKDP